MPLKSFLLKKPQLKKTRKKPEKAKLVKKLDILFSQKIRERDRYCVKCGKESGLQCAHLISRTYRHLRWDSHNAVSLCYSCHLFWAHRNPLEFVEWIQETFPEMYVYVMKERYKSEQSPSLESLQELYEVLLNTRLAPIVSEF